MYEFKLSIPIWCFIHRLKTEILIDMLAQKTAEVDVLLRDNEQLRRYVQENIKHPISKENVIWRW